MLRMLLAAASFLTLTSTAAFAADQENAVSFELLGRGLLYSINYDRAITEEITVGGGFSAWSVSATTDGTTVYDSASILIIPLYLDYYFYKKDNHRFYATGGLDIISAKFKNDSFKFNSSGIGVTAGAGYEFRGESGFLFRGALYIIAGGGGAAIWPGLSLGYAF